MNEVDSRKVRLEHLQKLNGSGYDISCADCGYMYKNRLSQCEKCGSGRFIQTAELIRKLELSF